MTRGQLNADVEQYLQAAASNTPPPIIASDPVVAGTTPVEQWMAVLTAAANLSDATDNARSAEEHAERDAKLREAAEKFAVQDEHAAVELKSIAAEPYTVLEDSPAVSASAATVSQQVPQMASGIAGALAGAVSSAFQPLAQLPQQATQGIQQAMQSGMGLLQQAAGEVALPLGDTDVAAATLDEDFGVGASSFDGLDGFDTDGSGIGGGLDADGSGIGGGLGAAGGGLGPLSGTAPTGYLGPPPVPPSSVSTAPSSAPITSITAPSPAVAHPPGATGMAGMPMVPPGALGAAAKSDHDDKADTKRVSVPPVRNGAPVQGRLTVPPEAPPLTKNVDGRPVVTRRVLAPIDGQSAEARPGS